MREYHSGDEGVVRYYMKTVLYCVSLTLGWKSKHGPEAKREINTSLCFFGVFTFVLFSLLSLVRLSFIRSKKNKRYISTLKLKFLN